MRFWGAAGEDPSGQERVLSRVVNPLAAHVRQQAAGLLQNDLRSTPQVLGLQSRLESRGRQQDWILKCLQCGRSHPLATRVATLNCSTHSLWRSALLHQRRRRCLYARPPQSREWGAAGDEPPLLQLASGYVEPHSPAGSSRRTQGRCQGDPHRSLEDLSNRGPCDSGTCNLTQCAC